MTRSTRPVVGVCSECNAVKMFTANGFSLDSECISRNVFAERHRRHRFGATVTFYKLSTAKANVTGSVTFPAHEATS